MGGYYRWNTIPVLPDDLQAWAWSAPMRDLGAKIDVSDVGLKKLLKSHGVITPPQGYWNKIHAGKPVPKCPRTLARRPGEHGRMYVDQRLAGLLPRAAPCSSDGPFASAAVPEDLEALRAQELKAIGRATVPKTLDAPHRALVHLLKKEKLREQKDAERQWNWDPPLFDKPLARRKLRILNAIFLALAKRGYGGDVSECDGELSARAVVGDTYLGLAIAIVDKHRTVRLRGYIRPEPDLPLSTPLQLRIDPGFDGKSAECWQDDASGKVESKIAEITAAIIVAAEGKFRRGLKEAEEQAERDRQEREERRLKQLAVLNEQRLGDLHKSGDLLRQAQDIRALVDRVRDAISTTRTDVDPATLIAWERWALREADKIDPVLSGQVLSHLYEPTLDQVQLTGPY